MFGNKEEKAAQDAAAEAEAERLIALPVPELAGEMLAAFGPDGPSARGGGLNILQIGNFMMASFPRGTKQLSGIQGPMREGVQALENAGLVERLPGMSGPGGRLRPTRLGEDSLADGSVQSRLEAR